jgi:hypothetical protein
VAIASRKLPGNGNGAFTFEIADHRRYRVLGRYLNAYVDMIGHQMPFDNLALLLPSQLVKDRAQRLADVPK